ncbi:uncharacterized protein LOC129597436 [Paramacrobiotus metropolitanus]|uniref:uncharacterized protein LOC129597436 n=1 Tax=Paramacrobiotus metropolitanus TaxID=2943436 RepID=UPI0024461FD8|nr:uncharacterized protein LOC129597436 [Paramacrobiotus metropolitanus]
MLITVLCVILSAALFAQGAEETTPNPACNDFAMLACLMAPMAHFMSPIGMAMLERMGNRTGSEAQFTQEDITMICQVTSTAGQCLEGYINNCFSSAGNGSNFHQFFSGSLQISKEFCARSSLYADGKLAYECLNELEKKDNGSSCGDDEEFEDPFHCNNASMMELQQHQVFFQQNDVLGHLCCTFDKVKQCAVASQINSVCSADARRVIGELVGVIDKAYTCADRLKDCATMPQRIRTKANNCRLAADAP